MIHENEMVMLLIGLGCLFFIVLYRARLTRIREWKFLMTAFCLLLTSWLTTVVEGFFWDNFFNYIEHVGYAASSIFLALWFWKTAAGGDRPDA